MYIPCEQCWRYLLPLVPCACMPKAKDLALHLPGLVWRSLACSTALSLMLLQSGAAACPAAVGKHGMRSFILLQSHFRGVGDAVMCELPGEERAHGWRNNGRTCPWVSWEETPYSLYWADSQASLGAHQEKGSLQVAQPFGIVQILFVSWAPAQLPVPGHLCSPGRCRVEVSLCPTARVQWQLLVALLAIGSQCNPGFLNGKLSWWHLRGATCWVLFVQLNVWGMVSLPGEALLASSSTRWERHSSSQPGISTSHENRAQGILGLAFKTQDSDSSEHFTKPHWNGATVEFIIWDTESTEFCVGQQKGLFFNYCTAWLVDVNFSYFLSNQ